MRLKTIGTGSTGNCYLLEDEGELLLLDAGLPGQEILRGMDYRVEAVHGCLITHEHGDHVRGVKKLCELGIPLLATPGTCKADSRLIPVRDTIRLGPFRAMPVPMVHDARQPCGWLIANDRTGERLLYATDTSRIQYRFPFLDYWLVECNYCEDLLGDTSESQAVRLMQTHMSLTWLAGYLGGSDLKTTRQIILCHQSRVRGDKKRMERRIAEATDKPVCSATPGEWIALRQEPF